MRLLLNDRRRANSPAGTLLGEALGNTPMTKTTRTWLWASAGVAAASLLLAVAAYWQTREKPLKFTEVSVLKAAATDAKVAPDMEGPFFLACYGGWLGEKIGGQYDKNCQYLYCSGFKMVEFITEGPDGDSVLVMEQKGHEEEARVYRVSQRLNLPQHADLNLESLPGGLYRSGSARLEVR